MYISIEKSGCHMPEGLLNNKLNATGAAIYVRVKYTLKLSLTEPRSHYHFEGVSLILSWCTRLLVMVI
ncbi:hypothetical protein K2173_013969 [Erythroxylum novogranatense]|uniref:Uncharacterized protein n=1 Tax=Erythroxylum novogranatense TaxID=1862640 RepID=A0AAV8SD48_9ROSI|nr:hypothetical protein K2173_013969 [Erythroxylum novogranatense]